MERIKKIIGMVILVPLAVILVVLCVANRQSVTLALNPFNPSDTVLSLTGPSSCCCLLPCCSEWSSALLRPGLRRANIVVRRGSKRVKRSSVKRAISREARRPARWCPRHG